MAATPPPPDYFQLAEADFEAGDYTSAAKSYQLYLYEHPSAANQDRALFHLAMTYAFANSPMHDVDRAMEVLERLVNLLPESPYASQARFILGLRAKVEKLRSDVFHFQREIEGLKSDAPRFQAEIETLKSNIVRLQNEVDKLKFNVGQREERIQELSEELEKLKQIDIQRRPSRPRGR